MFNSDGNYLSRENSAESTQTAASSTTGRRGRGGRGGRGRGGRGRGRSSVSATSTDAVSVHSTDDVEHTPVARRGRGGRGRGGSASGRGRGRATSASPSPAPYSTTASASLTEAPLSQPPTPPADGVPIKRKRGRPPKNPPSLPASGTGALLVSAPLTSSARRRSAMVTGSTARGSTSGRLASQRGATTAAAPTPTTAPDAMTGLAAGASAVLLSAVTAPTSAAVPGATPCTSMGSSGSSLTLGSARSPPALREASSASASLASTSRSRPRTESGAGGDEEDSGSRHAIRTRRDLLRRGGHPVGASTRASLNAARDEASASAAARHDAQALLHQAQLEREARLALVRDRLVWRVKRFRAEDDAADEDQEGVGHASSQVRGGAQWPLQASTPHAVATTMMPPSCVSVTAFEDQLARHGGSYTLLRTRVQPASSSAAPLPVGGVNAASVAHRNESVHITSLSARLGEADEEDATEERPSVEELLCPFHVRAAVTVPSLSAVGALPLATTEGRVKAETDDDLSAGGDHARTGQAYAISLLQRAGVADSAGHLLLDADAAASTALAETSTASPSAAVLTVPSPAQYLDRLVQEAASQVTSSTSSVLTGSWEQYAMRALTAISPHTSSSRSAATSVDGTDGSATGTASLSVSPLLTDSFACHAQPHISLYAPLFPRSADFASARQFWRARLDAAKSGADAVKREPAERGRSSPPRASSALFMTSGASRSACFPQFMRHHVQSVVVPIVVGSYAKLIDATSRDKSHVWTVYVRGLFDGHVAAVAGLTESHTHDAANTNPAAQTAPIDVDNDASNPDKKADGDACWRQNMEENYLAHFIESVTFVLDKSFTPCVRTVYQPPFEVTEHGWGEFVVSIHVHLRYRGYTHTAAAQSLRHELRHFAYTSHGRAVLQGTTPLTSGRALFDPVSNSQTLFGAGGSSGGSEVTDVPVAPTSPTTTPSQGHSRPAVPSTNHANHSATASATTPGTPNDSDDTVEGVDATSSTTTATGVGGASGGGTLRGAAVHPHLDSRRQNFAQQLLDMNHCSAIRPLVYRGPLLPPHLHDCDSASSGSENECEIKTQHNDAEEGKPTECPTSCTRSDTRVKREADGDDEGDMSTEAPGRGVFTSVHSLDNRRRTHRRGAWMSDINDAHGQSKGRLRDSALGAEDEDDGDDGQESFSAYPSAAGLHARTLSTDEMHLADTNTNASATTARMSAVPVRRGPGRPVPSEAARRTRLRKAAVFAAARADAARQLEGSVKDSNVVILSHALRFSHRTTLPTGIPPTGDFRTDLARREQYAGYVLVPEPVVTEHYDEIIVPLIQSEPPRGCWYATTNLADQRLLWAAAVLETSARRVFHHYLRERGFIREAEHRALAASSAPPAVFTTPTGGHWSGPHKKTTAAGATGLHALQKARGAGRGDGSAGAVPPPSLAKAAATIECEHAGGVSCWSSIVHDGDAVARDAVLTGSYLTSVAASASREGWLAHSLSSNHAYWFAAETTSKSEEKANGRTSCEPSTTLTAAVLSTEPPAASLATESGTTLTTTTAGRTNQVPGEVPRTPYTLTTLEFDLLSVLLLLPALEPRWDVETVMRGWVGPWSNPSALSLLTSTILAQRMRTSQNDQTARRQRLMMWSRSSHCECAVATPLLETVTLPEMKTTFHTALGAGGGSAPLLCFPRWRPSTSSASVATLASLTCAPPATGGTVGTRHPPATGSATAAITPTFTSGLPCGLFGADKDVKRLQMHRDVLRQAIHEMRVEMAQRQAIEVFKRV